MQNSKTVLEGTVHDVPDQFGMLKSISKKAIRISNIEDVVTKLMDAVTVALTPPMGFFLTKISPEIFYYMVTIIRRSRVTPINLKLGLTSYTIDQFI